MLHVTCRLLINSFLPAIYIKRLDLHERDLRSFILQLFNDDDPRLLAVVSELIHRRRA